MPNIPITISANGQEALGEVKRIVTQMKAELGKLAKVATGKGASEKEITAIVNKVISGQKGIQREIDKTKKKTKNWLNEYRKLMAVATKPGVGAQTKELALRDAKAIITGQVKKESAKGAEASVTTLTKQEKRLDAIDKLTRQRGVLEHKANAEAKKRLLTATKMGSSIKDEMRLRRSMVLEIAKANQASLMATHKLRTNTEMGRKQKIKVLRAEIKHTKQLGRTNEELKKGVVLTRQAAEETRRLADVGKRPAAGTMADPSSISRQKHIGHAPATQKALAGGWIPAQDIKNMDKVRTFAADIQKYAKFQIRWFASATAIFATAGAIAAAAKSALGYYQALKNIAAVTDKTDEQMRAIGAAALYVAETTPMGATAAVKMSLKLVQAGLDTKDAAEAMKTTAAVVAVSGEDMDTVAKAVTTAMFAWHKGAEDVAEIGNVLAGALNYSRLTVEDLGTAFNYLAATSSIMGRTLEETAASLSVLSNMGIRASTIGTGFSQLMTQMIAPTAKLQKELTKIGLSANDVNPSMNKFVDILRKLEESSFSTTKAMDILGARAGRILAAALVAGSKEFDRMERKIRRQGMLQKALAKVMEGPISALKNMKNQLEIASIEIGSVAVPVLEMLIQVMKGLFASIKMVTSGLAFLVQLVGGGANAATAIMIASVVRLIFYIKSLGATSTIASVGVKGLWAAINLNPITKAITLITAFLALLGFIKKKVSDAAKAHKELADTNEYLAKKALMNKEAQEELERAVVNLKESWEALGRIDPEFPFLDKAFIATAEINKMTNATLRFSEVMEEAKKRSAAIPEVSSNVSGGWKQLMHDILGMGDVYDIQVQNKKNTEAAIVSAAKVLDSVAEREFGKSQKKLRKILSIRPEEMGLQFFKAWTTDRKQHPLVQVMLIERSVVNDIVTQQGNIRMELNRTEEAFKKAVGGKAKAKLQVELGALSQKYNSFTLALKQATNEFKSIWKKIVDGARTSAKELERVKKKTTAVRAELESLSTADPLADIAANLKKSQKNLSGELEINVAKLKELGELYKKAQEAVGKEEYPSEKERVAAEAAILKPLRDQIAFHAEINRQLKERRRLEDEVAAEKTRQEKNSQFIARAEIKRGKEKRITTIRQAELDARRTLGLVTSVEHEKATIDFKRQSLIAEGELLRIKMDKGHLSDLELETLQAQLDVIVSQEEALDGIILKRRRYNAIEKQSLQTAFSQIGALNEAADTSIMGYAAEMETTSNAVKTAANNYASAQRDYWVASWDQKDAAKQQMEAAMFAQKQAEYNRDVVGEITRLQEMQRSFTQVTTGVEEITAVAMDDDPYIQSLIAKEDATAEHHNTLKELYMENRASMAEIDEAAKQVEAAKDKTAMEKKIAIAKSGLGMMAGIANTMYTMSEGKNKKAFEAYKIFAAAEATVATIQAAASSFAAGSKIGGPVTGAAFAAIATAAGMLRVAQIKAMQPGKGAQVGGGAAVSAPEYKYYGYESSEFGSGWRPGEGQSGYNVYADKTTGTESEAVAVTQEITINAMDSKSVEQLVADNAMVFVAPMVQNIKDAGELKDVILNYV